MNQEERAIIVWSVFFVMSGFVFIVAFMFSPAIGALVTLAYIILYVGLSAAFVMVFRTIESLRKDTLSQLSERHDELEDVKKAIRDKYFQKKIDPASFRKMMEDYEKKLTEIEVKMKRMEKRK